MKKIEIDAIKKRQASVIILPAMVQIFHIYEISKKFTAQITYTTNDHKESVTVVVKSINRFRIIPQIK